MPVVAILMECICSCSGDMALTPSTMLPLGTDLPDFQLPTVAGGSLNRDALDQNPVLMMVICAHCPFVKHIEPELTRLDRDYSCLLYTSPSPRDLSTSRMPSSA